jgi:hypothetical protein
MLKYLFVITIAISMIACESEPPPQDPAQQQPMDQEMPGQMQQPTVDTEVSDEELDQFLDASAKAQEVQMGFQQQMIDIVEDEGIEVETYIQIAEGIQMGQAEEDIDVSEADMEKFHSASASIEEIGQEMDAQLAEAIEEEGMSMDRFQEINMAIQQDPELQQRIQEKMGAPQMQQQQPDAQPQEY